MILNRKLKSLVAIALLSSLSSFAKQSDNTTSDQVELGFWKDPNLIHVSTEWPTDDDDLEFWDVPELEKAFVDTAPTDRNDGLIVGKLETDGVDKDMIIKLAQEIADGQHDKIDSLLIAHRGKLVFESYYSWGRANLTHPQASATKTYTGLALGRAIQLGYLSMSDLEKPLVHFLKDLDPSKFIKGAEKITLYQALTMTTGIRVSDENKEEMQKNPERLKGQGEVQLLFEHSDTITTESQKFAYSAGPQLVMQVVEAVVPGSAEDFIKKELFGKMGITTYRWLPGESGLPAGGWKSSITSRSMAKIGTLAMNEGRWQGEQLIPQAFMAQAISRLNYSADDVEVYGGGKDTSNQGYGYFWWSADLKVGDKNYFSASAQGGGGQFVILIEELDLMIVVTGHERHPSTLQLAAERILPAFIQNSKSTMIKRGDDQYKFPILEGPYMGQEPPGLVAEPFAPGIISKEGWELEGVFAPGMKEFYFTTNRKSATVIGFRQQNNTWKKYIEFPRRGEIVFSPDGNRMHMAKGYKERVGNGWSERKSLGPMFDREDWGIMRLAASANGTYVFDDYKSGDVIRISSLIDGKRQEPKKMGSVVNTGEWTAHPFIAPDESYLIWDSEREDGYGGSDLYISFRQKNGSWGSAINMGENINSSKWDAYASVTPDGKYILFNRGIDDDNKNVDIYWADARIIETLRQKQS